MFRYGWSLKYWLLGVLSLEILSVVSHTIPTLLPFIFILLTGAFIYICLRLYPVGLLIALTELFMASQGHIISLASHGYPISIRMMMFSVLMGVALYRLLPQYQSRQVDSIKERLVAHWPIWLWLIVVGGGVIFGITKGIDVATIFFDANNYLFLLFVIPLAFADKYPGIYEKIFQVLIWSAVYVALKTIWLEYFFTHGDYQLWWPSVYAWLRDTRVAEITFTSTGAYRIFMQSQIFLLPAWWLVLWQNYEKGWRDLFSPIAIISILSAGILISFSRSFWLGWLISGICFVGWMLYTKQAKPFFRMTLIGGVGLAVGVFLIWLSINIPIPSAGRGNLDLVGRLDLGGEAAASSRWNMLGPLWDKIYQSPLLGQGIGVSVAYISDDPRVRAISADGWYEATSFEWGYLDQWLDLGLGGVLLVVILGGYIFYTLMVKGDYTNVPLALGLAAIYGVHIGTPYLNHPLGIVYLLLLWCKIKYDRLNRQLA